ARHGFFDRPAPACQPDDNGAEFVAAKHESLSLSLFDGWLFGCHAFLCPLRLPAFPALYPGVFIAEILAIGKNLLHAPRAAYLSGLFLFALHSRGLLQTNAAATSQLENIAAFSHVHHGLRQFVYRQRPL